MRPARGLVAVLEAQGADATGARLGGRAGGSGRARCGFGGESGETCLKCTPVGEGRRGAAPEGA
jgi:hypothetical protein